MVNIIGLIFIGYYLGLKLKYGGLVFSEFFLTLGLLFIFYPCIKSSIQSRYGLFLFVKVSMIGFISVFILLESCIIFFPTHNRTEADYVIVLGAAVKQTNLSLTLKARLDATLNYLSLINSSPMIVVSGGQGSGETISEAQAMKNYLVQNGVDERKIILEDKATNTFENFKYSKEKIESHSLKDIREVDIKVVTSDFHCFRSNLLAKRNGYEQVTYFSSYSRFPFTPTYYTREFFALIKAFIFN